MGATWADARALFNANVKIHALRGEQPTPQFTAFVWCAWYGGNKAIERVGRLLNEYQDNYWHEVGYFLTHPELFDLEWEHWEKKR